MSFDFIPPTRLVDKTIGSYPIVLGTTDPRLVDLTIGAVPIGAVPVPPTPGLIVAVALTLAATGRGSLASAISGVPAGNMVAISNPSLSVIPLEYSL